MRPDGKNQTGFHRRQYTLVPFPGFKKNKSERRMKEIKILKRRQNMSLSHRFATTNLPKETFSRAFHDATAPLFSEGQEIFSVLMFVGVKPPRWPQSKCHLALVFHFLLRATLPSLFSL